MLVMVRVRAPWPLGNHLILWGLRRLPIRIMFGPCNICNVFFTSCNVVYVAKHCPNLAGPFAVYTIQGSPVPTFSWVRWWGIGLSEVMCGVGQKIIGVSHVKSPGSGDCGSGLRPPWFDGTKGPGGDLLGVYVNVFAAKFFCKITVSIFRQECSGNTPKVDPPVTVETPKEDCFMLFGSCMCATCLCIIGV